MTDSASHPSPLYAVTKWHDRFENNRSRVINDLGWVPVPNKHDGEKYALLMQHKDAAKLFAAWVLILQVASRVEKTRRGDLVRSDGTPYDAAGLALRTRAPVAWFDLAFVYFTKNGWLFRKSAPGSDIAAQRQADVSPASGERQADVTEGKEEKGKEGKGNEENPGRVPPAEVIDPIQSRMLAVNALKRRQPSTVWSLKENAAFKAAGLADLSDEDFSAQLGVMSAYYIAPASTWQEHWRCAVNDDFRRRDLLTLLNNWPGELDRAHAAVDWHAKKSAEEAARRG